MYPYAVIKFVKNGIDDDEDDIVYTEIPTVWICMNQHYCWWPNSKNVRSLMLKGVLPNNSWSKHRIELHTYCHTLEKARKKSEKLIYASIEENGRKRKKNKQKRARTDSDDSSSDSDAYCALKKRICTTNIKSEPIDEDDLEAAASSTNRILESIMANSNMEHEEMIESVTGVQRTSKFEETLLDVLTSVKNSIKNIELRLSALEAVRKYGSNPMESIMEQPHQESVDEIRALIPLKTIEEVEEFENLLKSPDSALKIMLLNYLKTIGGDHVKNFLVRMLQRMFTNDLAQKCSWLGQRHNFRICDLVIINAIRETLMQFHVLREKEFESMCSEWFRQGKMRYTREIQRLEKQNMSI